MFLRPLRRRSKAVRPLGAAAAVIATTLLASAPGRAFHTQQEHITDDTAWAPESGTFRIGLYKMEYALHDRFSMGTYLWPWLFKTSSLYAKWNFYSGSHWNWATRFGFFHLDTSAFDNAGESAAVFNVVPFEIVSTVRLDANDQLSQALVFTAVRLSGNFDEEAFRGAGEGGVTNVQYVAAYEHRYSRKLALVISGRYLLAQVAQANANAVFHPDEFTTIEIIGDANDDESLNFRGAFSVVPSLVWSWDIFNLRLGLGYGNLNIPGVNFVLPTKSLIPDFDLYWVFD